jgi:hypothetical protein
VRPSPSAKATSRERGGDNHPIEPEPTGEPSSAPASRLTRLLSRVGDWLLPRENPSGAVYGLIVIGALLAAESGRHETWLDTFVSAVIAAALYWLAHGYAGLLGRRLSGEERLTADTLARSLAHDWALVRGASIPLLALLVAALLGASQETAVTTAVWISAGGLVAFELIAGLRSKAGRGELALELTVGVTMGVAILALKIVLH